MADECASRDLQTARLPTDPARLGTTVRKFVEKEPKLEKGVKPILQAKENPAPTEPKAEMVTLLKTWLGASYAEFAADAITIAVPQEAKRTVVAICTVCMGARPGKPCMAAPARRLARGGHYKYTSNFLYATTQVEHPYKCGQILYK